MLVVSPHGGYERNGRNGHTGQMFLKWMTRATELAIRTSGSASGEYRHKFTDERGKERFLKLGGYVAPRNGRTPIEIEFPGCYVHGQLAHIAHMAPETLCANGRRVAINHAEDERRRKVLEDAGFDVTTIYKCEAQREQQTIEEMFLRRDA
ncbi:hypothetical protein AAVH_26317 [Aphelenchoides avenae]|nr:hypothetical protein AAVH_26317 [Aphelenchus avenae]